MPLPSDERIIALSHDLLHQFDTIFGLHPGFRPAHAKGTFATGEFKPHPDAVKLSKAPHLSRPSTPVTVRFSNSTGVPVIPDTDPNSNPRGIGLRFHLADRVHTDIIAHSTDGFPTRTGAEFLDFLRALVASSQSHSSPSPVEQFLGSHPAALAYVQTPKPAPVSFATEAYFGVTAMRFINADGAAHYGRYRIIPDAGLHHLDNTALQSEGPDYLFQELESRLSNGPATFNLLVQIADPGDVTDDATIHWPENRQLLNLGQLTVTSVVPANQPEQQRIIFDPIPRVDGIEPSDDPLLELRAAIYLLSGRRRRETKPEISTN